MLSAALRLRHTAKQQDRTGGVLNNSFSYTAEQHVRKSGSAMR